MIGTPITIKNHDTGNNIIINDHVTDKEKVIALQTFPTFETDYRAQSTPKNGAHGEIRLPYYYSGMSIVLQGVIVGTTEADVWEIKKSFDDIMSLSKTGFPNKFVGNDRFPPMFNNTVRLSFINPNNKKVFIDATPVKAVSYDRPVKEDFRLNFQVILRANLPFLLVEDEEAVIETGTLGELRYGLKLPFELPFSLNNEYITNEMEVVTDNAGFARVKLFGADNGVIVNPRVINLTNGTFTKINKSLYGADRYFYIDGLYQEMKDESGNDLMPYSDGDFIYLEAGTNILVYTADRTIPQ